MQNAKGLCLPFIAAAMCLVCSCSSNGQQFTEGSPDEPKYHIYENPYWQFEVDEHFDYCDLLDVDCDEYREPLEARDTAWLLTQFDTCVAYSLLAVYASTHH